MPAVSVRTLVVALVLSTGVIGVGCSTYASKAPANLPDAVWNPKAAAAYLDRRAEWWMRWEGAARGNGTFCISCHTTLPYALSRASLRAALAQPAPSIDERKLLDDVTKRVHLGNASQPYYDDQGSGEYKTAESRGTESVLNALILATRDSRSGHEMASDTRMAFENMWALQLASGDRAGAWPWLQFGLKPWEAGDSQYYGAALAAIAVGTAPADYRASTAIQSSLSRLRNYLASNYSRQSLSNRLVLLWASSLWTDVIDSERRASLEREVLRAQQADGGWCLSPMARSWRSSTFRAYARSWIRKDHTLVDSRSDGYATGLAVFALLKSGVPPNDVHLRRGLHWLADNQNPNDGRWPGYSLNERRDPGAVAAPFMSDAATAFGALALIEAGNH
jgi:squalene-hopene/tetraprenyl-beta-curcumene cyclase